MNKLPMVILRQGFEGEWDDKAILIHLYSLSFQDVSIRFSQSVLPKVPMMNERNLGNSPDAQFRFAMSEDGMKLGVSRYFPPNGGEGPSVRLLRRQIVEAGVRLPVDSDAARKVVDAIQQGGEIRRIVLVRGIEAQEPQDASIVSMGNLDFPVFPGDSFARKRPALKACDGETIDGRILKAQKHFEPKDIKIEMGDNVQYDSLTQTYISQVWGMVRFVDNVITVDPILHISEDEISVTGTLHHKDFKNRQITPAQIEKELRDLGVVIDINGYSLDAALRKATSRGKPLTDHPLAEGKRPIPGRDGWLEYLVSTRELTGTEDDTGRLDFKDRGAYPMVEQGQTVGRLHAPTAGEGGIDIYGKTIPASGGRELHIHLGENVTLLNDGVTYEAKTKGIMIMDRNVLSITECLLIPGNVDLTSGNVKVGHGSIKILGSIQAGFTVSAPKHVIVAGAVESSEVYAGGNIEISGGILMPEGGIIKAEGNVIANYATNAFIEAGGDVHIAHDTTNSKIRAEGSFYALKGKGIIQGGKIVATRGIQANEIGSELGVTTHVTIRIDHEGDEELRAERHKVKQAIQKIDDALGTDGAEAILQRTHSEKREAVAEVLKHRITLVKRRKSISEHLTRLALERQEELAGISIKARRFIYPGAVLKFGAKQITITNRTEASTIFWDSKTNDIAID